MKKPLETVIRTDADLCDFWETTVAAGGFGRRSIWMIFLDSIGRVLPTIIPIDDVSARPDRRLIEGMSEIVGGLLGDNGVASVALMLARPGPATMTDYDRHWARSLQNVPCGDRRWPIHLGTADRAQVFGPDDLIVSRAA